MKLCTRFNCMFLLALCCIAIMGCGGGGGGQPTGSLDGAILSAENDAGVAGITVSVAGISAITNSTGHYIIRGIAPGQHQVTVNAAGYIVPNGDIFVQISTGVNHMPNIVVIPDSAPLPPGTPGF